MVKINKRVVKQRMFDKDMNQKTLVEVSGLSKPTINRLMNGLSFDSETLGKLAMALECSPVDLIDPEGFVSPHMVPQASDLQSARN